LEVKDDWYCGDNIKCDIKGALNCSIKPIWYKGVFYVESGYVPDDCIEINRWIELAEYLSLFV
jgi:hypothetical protein